MSTTMPSASSVARRNVASTTYVAPCRRCAGPNTSPRRLWATIMWSRTVTPNIGPPSVGDHVAEDTGRPIGQARQHRREVAERRRPGEEGVEGRVAQQFEGQCEAIAPAAGG